MKTKRIVAVFCFVICFVGVLTIITKPANSSESIFPTVVTLLAGLLFWRSSKKQPASKIKGGGIHRPDLAGMRHVEGLPLAEKTHCSLNLDGERLIVSGGGSEFTLNLSQIGAAEIKTDVEIAHIVSSSAAKGIAGGLLFGPIGLVVGSRAKSKEKRTATPYLIINFTNSENELSAMMFEGSLDPIGLKKFVTKIKPLIASNPIKQVQL